MNLFYYNDLPAAELYFLITSSLTKIIVLVLTIINSDLLNFSRCLRSTKELEERIIKKKKDIQGLLVIILLYKNKKGNY